MWWCVIEIQTLNSHQRCLWRQTWVGVTGSGQVPEVVDEVQAVVVLHFPLGAKVGEQLQRLPTNLILSFCRHCPPASFWLVGHSGWSSTSHADTHARCFSRRSPPRPAQRRTRSKAPPLESSAARCRREIHSNPNLSEFGSILSKSKSFKLRGGKFSLVSKNPPFHNCNCSATK